MFHLGRQTSRTCSGISRRSFLQVGGLSLFGLNLPRVLASQAAQPAGARRDVNCILLWMGGGASNIDTFDMKPDAPSEVRGEFQQIASNVAGLPVCEHLPRMSRHMDKVCMVRSITHTESGDHVAATHYMMTGYPQRPDPTGQPVNSVIYPAFGSVVSRQKGWQNSLPPYTVLAGKGTVYTGAGYMGSAYDPLMIRGNPNDPAFRVQDVSIPESIGRERTMRRRGMLQSLDSWRQQVDRTSSGLLEREQFYAQAFDLITSPAARRAFDLTQEPAAVRDRYGRTQFGQSALLARRLIEAGCRFVTLSTHYWDTHQDNFRTLKNTNLPELDMYWSALLDDLADRGLLDTTLVVWAGEFGRTPRINGAAGRDHWAWTNAIGLSGAGTRMGTIVGQTDRLCERPVGTGHSTHDFAATLYHLLGIDYHQEYRSADGRPLLVNYHGRPIAEALA